MSILRNATKEEIKFGQGSLHYREIPFAKCFDENGDQLLKMKLADDGLIYYFVCLETRKGLKFRLVSLD